MSLAQVAANRGPASVSDNGPTCPRRHTVNITGLVMRTGSLQLVLPAAILVVAFAVDARAEDRGAAFSQQDLQAKLQYCKTCHGLSGQGFRGAFPMPRLAGQQPEYIENQLKAFTERRRTNPVMFNVAHALTPAMLAALTMEFRELNPKPL